MKRKLILLCLGLSPVLLRGQNFDSTLASRLQFVVDSIRIAGNMQGVSAAVYFPGQGTWQGTSGESYAGTPITTDMAFGLGSNTKLFTAAVVLKLASAQIVRLDDSLHHWLPSFANIDSNITIRQLLNHTSGLADVNNVPGFSDSILTNPNRIYTPIELMSWVGTPLFTPGSSWGYSNTNYIIAGMIAETATGRSLGQLLHDSILTPLQLDSTFLDVYDSLTCVVAHPWQTGIDNSGIPRKALNSASWAAGGMYSTAGEMTQWYRALMNGQVLDPVAFSEMTTFVGTGNYGCGIFEMVIAGRTVWEHGGTIWGGYNTQMIYDTASGAVITVLVNSNPAQAFPLGVALLQELVSSMTGEQEYFSGRETIGVFPNPAGDFVNVKAASAMSPGIYQLAVSDVTGHMLLAKEMDIQTAGAEIRLDTSGWPAGVYFLTFSEKHGARGRPVRMIIR